MSQQCSIKNNTLPYDSGSSLPHSTMSNSGSNINQLILPHDSDSSLSLVECAESVNEHSGQQQQQQDPGQHSQSESNSTLITDGHHTVASEGNSSLSQHVATQSGADDNNNEGNNEDIDEDSTSQLSIAQKHDSLLFDENEHGSQNSFATPPSPPNIKRYYTFPDENPTKFTPNYFAKKRGVKSQSMEPSDIGPVEPIRATGTQRRCFNRRVQPYPTIRNPEQLTRQQVRTALGFTTPPPPSITSNNDSTPSSQPIFTDSRTTATTSQSDDNIVVSSSLSPSPEEVKAYIVSHPAIFSLTQPGTISDDDDDNFNDANSEAGYNNYDDLDSD